MSAFKFDIANVYNNLTNIVIRITPRGAAAAKTKAVLVNAHYDSTLGTAGALGLAAVPERQWLCLGLRWCGCCGRGAVRVVRRRTHSSVLCPALPTGSQFGCPAPR